MNYLTDGRENQCVRLGDTCVIYVSQKYRYILKIQQDQQVTTKFGNVKATDLVGCKYGAKFDCKRGWIIPLRLTPELWTQILPHRTQILYQADISFILLKLDIKPGSFVAESGTGSGSLSHAILRSCLSTGHLYTFDISAERVTSARKEFEEHGFKNNVTVTNRDVCSEGFLEEMNLRMDACILDLPQTWDAIENAYKVLKKHRSRLCTFSPCIEQVQRNVAKMRELSMSNIETVECMLRPYNVEQSELREWSEEALDMLVENDRQKLESMRCKLVASDTQASTMDVPQKKLKPNDERDSRPKSASGKLAELGKRMEEQNFNFIPNMLPNVNQLTAVPWEEQASHSGFLTFAIK